jgi:hypothetical protein
MKKDDQVPTEVSVTLSFATVWPALSGTGHTHSTVA